MKKVVIGMAAITISTSLLSSMYIFNSTVACAETKINEANPYLSNYLEKLAENATDIMKIQMNIRKLPDTIKVKEILGVNVQTKEFSRLNTIMDKLKKNMIEWDRDLYPDLIRLNQKNRNFLNTLEAYYNSLNTFAQQDKHTNEEQEAFLAKLTNLESKANQHILLIQRYEQKQGVLQNEINNNKEVLSIPQNETKIQLKNSIQELKSQLEKSQINMKDAEKMISQFPSELKTAALNIVKDLFTTTREMLDPMVESAIKANKEIEESLQVAREKAKKEGTDVKKAEEEAREKLKKESKNPTIKEILSGESSISTHVKLSDIKIDMEKIDKMKASLEKVGKLTAAHKEALKTVKEEINKQYDLNRALQFNYSQQIEMDNFENGLMDFSSGFRSETKYLQGYIQDWKNIKSCIELIKNRDSNSIMDRTSFKKQVKYLSTIKTTVTA